MITMPPKVPKKGSKGLKKTKRPKVKKTVQLAETSDSDAPSESLLDPAGPTQQAVSDMEEGGEASQRPAATQATQEDPKDEDEDDDVPPRKKANMSEQMTMAQEQDLVEFFAAHPLFYDQTLKEFKDHPKKDRLLDDKGTELGMTGECTIICNKTNKKVATL